MSDDEGRTVLTLHRGALPHPLFALDAPHQLGACTTIEAEGDLGDVVLRPLFEVRGKVEYETDGLQPEETALWLMPEGVPGMAFCSGRSRSFVLRVPPGRYRPVYSNDRQGLYVGSFSGPVIEVRTEPVDLGTVEITIPKLVELRFLLRGPDGAVLPGAQVAAMWNGDWGYPHPVRGQRADDSGEAVLTMEVPRADEELAFLAVGPKRELGALVRVPPGKCTEPIEVELAPLVHVIGHFAYADTGAIPDFTNVYAYTADREHRVMRCVASMQSGGVQEGGRFQLWLPAGRWSLDGYGSFTESKRWELELTGEEGTLDLGTVGLTPTAARDLVGGPAPRFTVADARGVGRDVQPSDYAGRHLLLEFWGHW